MVQRRSQGANQVLSALRVATLILAVAWLPSKAEPVVRASLVANGSFGFSGAFVFPGYVNPPIGWAVSGVPVLPRGTDVGATIFQPGGFWDNGTVPGQGTTGSVAFIQRAGTLSQVLSGLTPGETYTLRFYENSRAFELSRGQVPILQVLINQATVVPPHSVKPAGALNDWLIVTATFKATAPSETLTFDSRPSEPAADTTVLFAQVTVRPASESAPVVASRMPSHIRAVPLLKAGGAQTVTVQATGSNPACYTLRSTVTMFQIGPHILLTHVFPTEQDIENEIVAKRLGCFTIVSGATAIIDTKEAIHHAGILRIVRLKLTSGSEAGIFFYSDIGMLSGWKCIRSCNIINQ